MEEKNKEDIRVSRAKKIRMILDSATFALLLSVVLFSYEMISGARETDEIVDNLVDIQNSLSTRYLGLFPEYIGNINNLLSEAIEHQDKSDLRDSIIIFEDVLYYGILSDAEGFRTMIENLLILAERGCHVTIAYYDIGGIPFKHMIRDKLISYEYMKLYRADMALYYTKIKNLRISLNQLQESIPMDEYATKFKYFVEKSFGDDLCRFMNDDSEINFLSRITDYVYIDSILCQKYYEFTRNDNPKKFNRNVRGYLVSIPLKNEAINAASYKANNLCVELDKIKTYYLKKDVHDISYSDYFNMYADMTKAISKLLGEQPNIELIPLNETLLMSCWMSVIDDVERAIFAFPSKYSTDEIGFISRDEAIARYIHTMLRGIKGSHLVSEEGEAN